MVLPSFLKILATWSFISLETTSSRHFSSSSSGPISSPGRIQKSPLLVRSTLPCLSTIMSTTFIAIGALGVFQDITTVMRFTSHYRLHYSERFSQFSHRSLMAYRRNSFKNKYLVCREQVKALSVSIPGNPAGAAVSPGGFVPRVFDPEKFRGSGRRPTPFRQTERLYADRDQGPGRDHGLR